MAFRREYDVKSEYASELYVEVFVRCQNCGNEDEIVSGTEVDYVGNKFHNESEDIESHGFCQACGEKDWTERGEVAFVGYQTALDTASFPTVDSLINTYASLIATLETARKLGFRVHSADTEQRVMTLWRELDENTEEV